MSNGPSRFVALDNISCQFLFNITSRQHARFIMPPFSPSLYRIETLNLGPKPQILLEGSRISNKGYKWDVPTEGTYSPITTYLQSPLSL